MNLEIKTGLFFEKEIVVPLARQLSWSHLLKMNFQNKVGLKGQYISTQGVALGYYNISLSGKRKKNSAKNE
jgi:hypothetical protein